MKSSLLLILFEILFLCHTIYGDVNPDSSLITKSERHRSHGSQSVSNDENYRQDEEHQINNANERHNKLRQHNPRSEGHDERTLGVDNESEDSNNTKLGSKIKSRITEMRKNLNKNNESNFGIAKIRNVRSSNRDHIHDRRDSGNYENYGNRGNDENRGMLGASGGLSGGLGGNIGGASAGTQFGIKFNGGLGSH